MLVKTLLAGILNNIDVRELVWTNPSPSVAFEPQTLNLDFTGYDGIEVVANETTSNQIPCNVARGYFSNNEVQIRNIYINGENISGYNISCHFRVSTATRNSITFGRDKYFTPTFFIERNDVLIPYKIYGIRKLGGGS